MRLFTVRHSTCTPACRQRTVSVTARSSWVCPGSCKTRLGLPAARCYQLPRQSSVFKTTQLSRGVLCCAENSLVQASLVERLKAEIAQLEEERDEAGVRAQKAATKNKRLAEAIEHLQDSAFRAIKQGDEANARKALEEKAFLTEALHKSKERAHANFALAQKVNQLVGLKQTELIAALYSENRDETAAGSVHIADDHGQVRRPGEPTSQSVPTPPSTSGAASGQAHAPADAPKPVSSLSDDDLHGRFLDIERDMLESMLRASGPDSSSTSSDILQDRQTSHGTTSTSGRSADGPLTPSDGTSMPFIYRQGSTSAQGSAATNPAEPRWWLEGLKLLDKDTGQTTAAELTSKAMADLKADAEEVTRLLGALVNGRVRNGRDPSAAQFVRLSQLTCLLCRYELADIPAPKHPTDLTPTLRQRLFRDATVAVISALGASAAGKTPLPWQHLMQLSPAASSAEAQGGQLTVAAAQLFLLSMAHAFRIGAEDAGRMCAAQVAAYTRGALLDAVAATKQVGNKANSTAGQAAKLQQQLNQVLGDKAAAERTQDVWLLSQLRDRELELRRQVQAAAEGPNAAARAAAAKPELERLARVLTAFAPPGQSAELDMVSTGLRGFITAEDRKLLFTTFDKICDSRAALRACAEALGLAS